MGNLETEEPLETYEGRKWYWQVPFTSSKIYPPPSSPTPIPDTTASWISCLTFSWMSTILSQGYARPLHPDDMYDLGGGRSSALYAKRLVDSFERRREDANAFNTRLQAGQVNRKAKRNFLGMKKQQGPETPDELEQRMRKPSLILAMNDAVFWWFWTGGLFRLVADVGTITSPLLVKAIIRFATDSNNPSVPTPNIGVGVGLAIGLFALLVFILVSNAQSHYRTFTSGVLLRGALIHALFSHAMRLTTRARSSLGLTTGKMTSLVSADVSRIDFNMATLHNTWTAPIQLIVCLIILCLNLGYSALPGFAIFVLVTPGQSEIMKRLFLLRKRSMVWTDRRVSLLQEIMGNMRLIKMFAWELPYLKKIDQLRKHEMAYLRSRLVLRSVNNALAFALPTLAAVVSFITYSATGHELEAGVVFTSLSLFNLLRTPMTALPSAMSAMADAYNAVQRIREVLLAETVDSDGVHIDSTLSSTPGSSLRPPNSVQSVVPPEGDSAMVSSPVALRVRDGEFIWDIPPPKPIIGPPVKSSWVALLRDKITPTKKPTAVASASKGEGSPTNNAFRLRNINIDIPEGKLVAIVGPVGSGKSSLLQGLIGDMRRVSGEVTFASSPVYCPQQAWIQNASVRDNILFGKPYDENRYWRVVKDACLMPDFDMLPHGDLTEVGEKGISLSGGQKQRINIARAVYFDSEITIFDDPFSALDAHVSRAVFNQVILKDLANKTRIVVTHALNFLPQTDYIIFMNNGVVVEQGNTRDMLSNRGYLFDSEELHGDTDQKDAETGAEEPDKTKKPEKKQAALMQAEDRMTGSISGHVYANFFGAAGLPLLVPLFIVAIVIFQGSNVLSAYWLVWWEEKSLGLTEGAYMGIYAMLGATQALGLFSMGCVFALFSYRASRRLHDQSLRRVVHAPVSFFDTTPLGRIMNRFSKDIDSIDNLVCESMRTLMGTMVQIIGAVALVSSVLPWFLIAVTAILIFYYWIALYYRSAARDIKRIDAVLRSLIYGHFTEAYAGVATIRAYGVVKTFEAENARRIDVENRAYWLSIATQRWLSVRLDFLGSLLVFAVALLVVGTRFSLSPSETGVALSYMLTVQSAFGWAVRQTSEVETSMSSVERMLHYAQEIEQEEPSPPSSSPPPSWPARGEVTMEKVVMSYRPGLPFVLKGVDINVRGGEHVAVVGRTGAGKSSIAMALYRTVELISGSIKIDGVEIANVELKELRRALSIIPQDPTLFSGTIRSNLDPFDMHEDLTLWNALRKACLVGPASSDNSSISGDSIASDGEKTVVPSLSDSKLSLDSVVEEGGQNFSVGQRSLISIARALVRDSRITILDEATASVDYATDALIQTAIQTSFRDGRTLICIAHRLRTILAYDKVCVMDSGSVVEFDEPIVLFDKPSGVFRQMCESSGVKRADVVEAMAARLREAAAHEQAS